MDKLTFHKEMLIIRLYLGGFSYDDIAAKADVAKGSVANVITRFKAGQFTAIHEVPELLEIFRQIATDMNKMKATPIELLEGASILPLLRDLGIEPGQVKSWAAMCKQLAAEKSPQEFVRAALYLDELRQRTGQTPQTLELKVHNLRDEEKKLESVTSDLKSREKMLQELNEKIGKVNSEMTQKEKRLDLLDKEIQHKEKRDAELSRRIAVAEEKALKAEERLGSANKSLAHLGELGLKPEDFPGFAARIAVVAHRHTMTPSALRNRLLSELEQLDAELGIESQAETRKRELAKIGQDIAKKSRELTALERTLDQMRQEKEDLAILMSQEHELIREELEATARTAKEAVSDFKRQLQQGIDHALQEVQKLQAHVFEAGQEAGKLQGTIEANEWLRKLLGLVKGDRTLPDIDVRAVAITTLTGTKLWLQQNAAGHLNSYSLSRKIDDVLQELQEWKL